MTLRNCVHALIVCIALTPAIQVVAQSNPYLMRFSFRGYCYQTNGLGEVVGTPITELDLLADRGDTNTMAIVYHFYGDEKGDTVDIVNASNGTKLALEFGLWFGADPTLGRSSLTNAPKTEVRSVDYIYTLDNFYYGSSNSHSSGAACITRRFMKDANGNQRFTAEGQLHWTVNPSATSSTKVITGTFTTTTPLL